jgi:hypothetical protein
MASTAPHAGLPCGSSDEIEVITILKFLERSEALVGASLLATATMTP